MLSEHRNVAGVGWLVCLNQEIWLSCNLIDTQFPCRELGLFPKLCCDATILRVRSFCVPGRKGPMISGPQDLRRESWWPPFERLGFPRNAQSVRSKGSFKIFFSQKRKRYLCECESRELMGIRFPFSPDPSPVRHPRRNKSWCCLFWCGRPEKQVPG